MASAGTTPGIFYIRMSQLCKSVQCPYRSKTLLSRLTMHRQHLILEEDTKPSHCGSPYAKYVELGH